MMQAGENHRPGERAEAQALRLLELDRVLELVAEKAQTAAGRQALLELRPAPAGAFAALRNEYERLAAWMELLRTCGPLPLSGIEDLRPFLEVIRPEESWLPPRELLLVAATLKAFAGISAYARRVAAEEPELYGRVGELFGENVDFGPLLTLLESCISDEEELRDEASLELADIRRQLKATRRKLSHSLQEILRDPELEPLIQDKLVTIRNQRYVLPLKTNFRQAIPGIIHDHSRTRQTCFVEPLESVALNNRLALLLEEEKQEEINILKMLAGRLRRAAPQLLAVMERALELDCLQARALFGVEQRAVAPELVDARDEGGFLLSRARHPLLVATLPPDRVVPIDIEFPAGRVGLVISGANTGGKTVSLKTAGLIVLMARCALPLPLAAESRVPLFDRVLAAIGDEQNLAASLSTFSGHLLAVKAILERADENSLVLLDELGVGTDPREGAALAQAVLAELKARRTSFMVTTHYNDVKAWAYEEEGVASVAVAFDPENFRPLYHLQYGVPGLSNALKIAENLGFPESLVAHARGLLGAGENRTADLAARLEKRLARLAEHEKELFHLKQAARIEAERARRLTAELRAARREVESGAREEIARLVREAKNRFRERLRELEKARDEFERARERLRPESEGEAETGSEPGASLGKLRGAYREACAEVEALLPESGDEALEAVDFSAFAVGDRVVATGQREPATIVELDPGRRRLTVLFSGGLRAVLGPEKIVRHLPAAREKPGSGERVRISRPAAGETSGRSGGLGATGAVPVLNLVGKRVDEAADLLARFIDREILAGSDRVEIIHGHGSGRLRQGVWEILRQMPYVSKLHHPDPAAGGTAVTVVELVGR